MSIPSGDVGVGGRKFVPKVMAKKNCWWLCCGTVGVER